MSSLNSLSKEEIIAKEVVNRAFELNKQNERLLKENRELKSELIESNQMKEYWSIEARRLSKELDKMKR